jgi:hypothetical protein
VSPCRAAILVAVCLLSRANADEKGIAFVETYGLHRVDRQRVLDVVNLRAGDQPPRSVQWKAITGRLERISGVKRAAIVVVTVPFESDKGGTVGRPIVYVGVQESDQPDVQFRPAPTGNVTLPAEIIAIHKDFERAFLASIKQNDFSEDDSNGYALMGNAAERAIQRKFPALADQHYERLVDVLNNSKHADQRAMAATFLGYASDKKRAVSDLVTGTRDANELVRNNAVRALSILMKYARAHRDLGIDVPTDWCLDLLESLTWTDRNKALAVLDAATADHDAALLASLRQRSLPALVEMSHWNAPGHGLMTFLLVGRIAGLTDPEIYQAWKAGKRDEVIERAVKASAARSARAVK